MARVGPQPHKKTTIICLAPSPNKSRSNVFVTHQKLTVIAPWANEVCLCLYITGFRLQKINGTNEIKILL